MTTDAPERQTQEPERDSPSLFLDGVLISKRVSFWRGRRPLTAKDLNLEESEVPEIYSLGSKLVIPREALARFERIEARAAYLLDQFTFPFPTGNARFIPYTVLPEVLEELKKLQAEFFERLTSFLARYDEYRQEIIERFPQAQEALERGYENADALRKRYHFEWLLYEVKLPRSIRYQAIEERDARADADARRLALATAEEEYKQAFQAQMDEFLGNSVGALREAVGSAAITLSEKITKGEVVTQPALDSLRKTIDRFRTLNFVGDNDVEAKLAELEAMIPSDRKLLKDNEEVRESFAAALNTVTETLVKSDVSEVTGEYKRRMRF